MSKRVKIDDLQTHEQETGERTITPQQLAEYWGVGYDVIWRDITKGALKATMIGRRWKIATKDALVYGKPNV